MTKHAPATPLPWIGFPKPQHILGAAPVFQIGAANGKGLPVASGMTKDHAAYIAHAANAYPRLVEALRSIGRQPREGDIPQQVVRMQRIANALLRELGEE